MKRIVITFLISLSATAEAQSLCQVRNRLEGVDSKTIAQGLLGGAATGVSISWLEAKAIYETILFEEYEKVFRDLDRIGVGTAKAVDALQFEAPEYRKLQSKFAELEKVVTESNGQKVTAAATFRSLVNQEIDKMTWQGIRDEARTKMNDSSLEPHMKKQWKIKFDQAIDQLRDYELKAYNDNFLRKERLPYNMDEVRAAALTIKRHRAGNQWEIDYIKSLPPEKRAEKLARAVVDGDAKITEGFRDMIEKAYLKLGEQKSASVAKVASVKLKGRVTVLTAAAAGVGALGYSAFTSMQERPVDQQSRIEELAAKIDADCANQRTKKQADAYLDGLENSSEGRAIKEP